jgi:hypothetical protein
VTKFTTLLEQYALLALEKQEHLSLLLGEYSWELDLDRGVIRFDGMEYPFQALGTESDNTLTWLWAWANEQTEIPDELLRSARELQAWGEREGIEEFTLPAVDLDRADGHMISMIASMISGASCHFRSPYEGGAAYLLITGREIDAQPAFDLTRLMHRFTDLISLYEVNHHNALTSYLAAKEIPFSELVGLVTARLASGEVLSVEFDETGRALSLNGALPAND